MSRLVTVVTAALIKDGFEYLFENAVNFSARTVIIMICILTSICVLENVCGAIHVLFHIHYISVFSVSLSSFISLSTLPRAITRRYFVSIFTTGKG